MKMIQFVEEVKCESYTSSDGTFAPHYAAFLAIRTDVRAEVSSATRSCMTANDARNYYL